MAAYFLDSSASVKRYVREVGTSWIIKLFRPPTPNVFYVAQIVSVEVVSAFARRLRGRSLTIKQATKAKERFRRDFRHKFFRITVDASLVEAATDLADKYALRGYDAVQLAAALFANNARTANNASPIIFICADNSLNAAAQAESLVIENPNNHP